VFGSKRRIHVMNNHYIEPFHNTDLSILAYMHAEKCENFVSFMRVAVPYCLIIKSF